MTETTDDGTIDDGGLVFGDRGISVRDYIIGQVLQGAWREVRDIHDPNKRDAAALNLVSWAKTVASHVITEKRDFDSALAQGELEDMKEFGVTGV